MYVVAYTGLQLGLINGNRLGYACLNGFAAGCILFSMIGAFNLSGVLVNAIFLTFSLVGVVQKLTIMSGERRRARVLSRQIQMADHFSSR
jgi:hypothetical protein